MHFRVPALRLVLGRTRRTDDGRIHDRASLDLAPVPRQVGVDAFKDLATQSVRLQKMPELAHRGLIRSPLAPQVNARDLAHRRNVIQRLLDRRVRKPIPVLKEVNSKHSFNAHRTASRALRCRIMGLDQGHQLLPWTNGGGSRMNARKKSGKND